MCEVQKRMIVYNEDLWEIRVDEVVVVTILWENDEYKFITQENKISKKIYEWLNWNDIFEFRGDQERTNENLIFIHPDYEPIWPKFQPLQGMNIGLNKGNGNILECMIEQVKEKEVYIDNWIKPEWISLDDFKKYYVVAKQENQSKPIQVLLGWKRVYPRWWSENMKPWEEKIKIFQEYIEVDWVKWNIGDLKIPYNKMYTQKQAIDYNWNDYFELWYAKKIAKEKIERIVTEEDINNAINFLKLPWLYDFFDLLWLESLWYLEKWKINLINSNKMYYNLLGNYANLHKRMIVDWKIENENKSFTPIRTIIN